MTDGARARLGVAGPWPDAVFHALSWLPVAGPSSLHHAGYLSWCRAHLPPETWAPLAEDAPILAARYDADPLAFRLHALPALHASLEGFLATSTRGLSAVDPSEVASPSLLGALSSVDETLVELLRADLALTARSFARTWDDALRPLLEEALAAVAPWFDLALAAVPSLGETPVRLSLPLGERGRSLGEVTYVGAPVAWSEALPPWQPCLQALHERAVSLAQREPGCGALSEAARASWAPGGGRYVWSEWRALTALERALEGTELQALHARWRARLDLVELTEMAEELGVDTDVDALVEALVRGRSLRGSAG